jgi:hypothetical protein
MPLRLPDDGENPLRAVEVGKGGKRAIRTTIRRDIPRRAKTTLVIGFTPCIFFGDDEGLDGRRVLKEDIDHGLGALNNEGAFSVSNPLISEKVSNTRGVRARQDGKRGQSSGLRLSTLAAGRRFRRSNALGSRFGSLEKSQLATRAVVLMLQLLELRTEVGLFLLVQGGAFLPRELHPIAARFGSFDPLLQ